MNYSWKQACADSGFSSMLPIPDQQRVVYAYKKGEAREFTDRKEALKFSNIVDEVWLSYPNRDRIIAQRNDAESKALDMWHAQLRAYWDMVDDKVFRVCYDEAYERGHSAGHDEVACYMHDTVAFAKRVMEVTKC
jgi:hypothetical protein